MGEAIKWDELTDQQKEALVGEKVFGYTVKQGIVENFIIDPVDGMLDLPNYVTDMNDAWKIVDKLYEQYDIRILVESGFLYKYHIRLWGHNGKMGGYGFSNTSMADAICEAALRSVGVEIE